VDALEVERCWVCRVDGALIRTVAGVNMVLADPNQEPLPLGKGVVGRCAREARTLRVDDVLKEKDYFAATALTRAEIAVPIVRDGAAVGVLNVEANRIAAFGDREQAVVEAVAELLAGYL
jgi:putative methionine-R-sulfoxide reductase with GAF domain